MKYALIGCGRIAVNHIKAVVNNGLELVAVCDLVPEHIDILFEKTGYTGTPVRYTDYRQMLSEHPELELAAIATDSGVHAEIALACLDAGLHVIVEKPMSMSMEDADRIINRARETGRKVAVCHQNRFNLAVQRMRSALDQGRFGRLSHGSVHVRWNRNRAYYEQAPWRGRWASEEEVYGQTRQQFHDYLECEDIGMAVLKFRNGAIATIEGTVNVYPKNLEETLYLFGETGTVKLGGTSCNNIDVWDFADADPDDDLSRGLKEATSNVYGNGHTSLYADMIEAIKDDRPPYVDAEAGRRALEVVLAIYRSQLTGLPVHLPLQDFASVDMTGLFGEGSL